MRVKQKGRGHRGRQFWRAKIDQMRLILGLIVACASLLLSTGVVDAQTDPDKITPEEARQANAFAHRFANRLLQTKDLKPLIEEFFVKDFDTRWPDPPLELIRDDQIRPARQSMIRRYYTAEMNFWYLLFLYWNSTMSPREDDDDLFQYFPRDVRGAFTRRLWDEMDKNESLFDVDKPPSDKDANEYFDKTLRALERAVPLLRKHAIRVNAGRTKAFRRNMREAVKNIDIYKPWTYNCDLWCNGFPKNTRFIEVNIPYFRLSLVKIDGQIKVLNFQPSVE